MAIRNKAVLLNFRNQSLNKEISGFGLKYIKHFSIEKSLIGNYVSRVKKTYLFKTYYVLIVVF